MIPYGVHKDELINFSLVLDLSTEGNTSDVYNSIYNGYKLSLYINGEEKMSSFLNVNQWSKFKEQFIGKVDTFDLGRCQDTDSKEGLFYQFGKMSLKNCRFYTRPLSAKEIKLNYDTRLAYDKNNI